MSQRPQHLLDPRLMRRIAVLRGKSWFVRWKRFEVLQAWIESGNSDPLNAGEQAWIVNDELERIASL